MSRAQNKYQNHFSWSKIRFQSWSWAKNFAFSGPKIKKDQYLNKNIIWNLKAYCFLYASEFPRAYHYFSFLSADLTTLASSNCLALQPQPYLYRLYRTSAVPASLVPNLYRTCTVPQPYLRHTYVGIMAFQVPRQKQKNSFHMKTEYFCFISGFRRRNAGSPTHHRNLQIPQKSRKQAKPQFCSDKTLCKEKWSQTFAKSKQKVEKLNILAFNRCFDFAKFWHRLPHKVLSLCKILAFPTAQLLKHLEIPVVSQWPGVSSPKTPPFF